MYNADLHECTIMEVFGARLGRENCRGERACVSAWRAAERSS